MSARERGRGRADGRSQRAKQTESRGGGGSASGWVDGKGAVCATRLCLLILVAVSLFLGNKWPTVCVYVCVFVSLCVWRCRWTDLVQCSLSVNNRRLSLPLSVCLCVCVGAPHSPLPPLLTLHSHRSLLICGEVANSRCQALPLIENNNKNKKAHDCVCACVCRCVSVCVAELTQLKLTLK